MQKIPINCLKCPYAELNEDKKWICLHSKSSFQFEVLKNPHKIPEDCPVRREVIMQQGRESRQFEKSID